MFADYFDDMSTTKEEGSEDLSLIQRGPPESEVAALSQDKVPLQQRNMTLNRSEYPAQNVPLKNKLTTEDGNVLSSLSRKDEERELQAEDGWLKGDFVAASIKDPLLQMTRIEQIETELHETLPGLPRDRIEKLRCEFETTLADPSLLKLVPLLREVIKAVRASKKGTGIHFGFVCTSGIHRAVALSRIVYEMLKRCGFEMKDNAPLHASWNNSKWQKKCVK